MTDDQLLVGRVRGVGVEHCLQRGHVTGDAGLERLAFLAERHEQAPELLRGDVHGVLALDDQRLVGHAAQAALCRVG